MLDFVIFAVTFVTVLIATVFYLYPGTRRSGTTIPGMDPSDPKDGNLVDIQRAGSLHEFLRSLHGQYGPIASFWLEAQLVVSLASPKLFTDHSHVFDRACDLFAAYRPLLGNGSVFFANGTHGRKQHRALVDVFSSSPCLDVFSQASVEMTRKLESLPVGEHVPLGQYMMALAAKSILLALFGDAFLETKNILEFRRNYEICMLDLEQKLQGISVDEAAAKSKVDTAIKALRNQMRATLTSRRSSKQAKHVIVDKLLVTANESEDQLIDNALTYVHCGFQSTGYLLTWLFYYLAANPDVQEKVYEEVSTVDVGQGGGGGDEVERQINKMKYTRQVVNETLRLSNVVPFATRTQDLDVEVGGHRVPKNTPVVHALGVVHRDDDIWTSSEKFDPERFSPNSEQSGGPAPHAFVPFGFGGKRLCPASQMVATLALVVLVNVVRRLTIRLMDDDQIVQPNYCVYAKPQDEIWAIFAKRTDD